MFSLHTYYAYRELIWNLVVADLKNRYKNSALGFIWSFMNPLLTSLVLIFVFTQVFRFDIPNYPLYLISGIIPWRFFAYTKNAMAAITAYSSLVRKIYFPREILVISSCFSILISAGIEFAILIALTIPLGAQLGAWTLLVPVIFTVQFIFVVGVSLALSALYVYFKDLEHIWEVVLQVGFYAAPIIYKSDMIARDSGYYWILLLNPMSHFIITYRHLIGAGAGIVESEAPALGSLIGIAFFTVAAYVAGIIIFKRLEPHFAEEV